MTLRIDAPIISSAVKPNSCSAALFHEVTMPSRVLLTIASSEDATMAARCARRRSNSSVVDIGPAWGHPVYSSAPQKRFGALQ